MGLLEIASGNSFWRGYDYFRASKVKMFSKISEDKYSGIVSGSEDKSYKVYLDLEHPKKSTCTCPHSDGTRRVCKHKVALYFAIFPEAADKALKDAEEWEEQEKARIEEERKEIKKYVFSLSKQELREELLWRLIDEMDDDRYR